MSAAATVLDRLDGVRQSGPGRWLARCPAHEDRSPSLSIRELDDGRVLLHDFGGCDTQAVLDALGKALDWTDYLEGHARRVYAPITDDGLTAAHALLARRSELTKPFTLRDVAQKHWSGLDRDTIEAALECLAEYGHVDSTEKRNRRSLIY
ncbi:MAG: hypothetical protein KGL45_16380 [Gammaproteobacteria bacterium]|nr:hypothetical protein [Gammaproteobacteria bacterium]